MSSVGVCLDQCGGSCSQFGFEINLWSLHSSLFLYIFVSGPELLMLPVYLGFCRMLYEPHMCVQAHCIRILFYVYNAHFT